MLKNQRKFLATLENPSKIDFKECVLVGGINRLGNR
ncbi:hypothetical protein P7955_37 [Streptococcus phage P7955]|uniref:Uncharacterized protein n=1 Tax=Streptococcus phage P7955 TaxID=1971440 RepID=A0A286QSI2_9CAUD|nr:hypothetical protein PQF05_gp37 [Streptococcus phage P7955]ARU14406.1 hypothetical protein P7955_37 [Streptococcus phage P7955]